jgi:hypothetical protein
MRGEGKLRLARGAPTAYLRLRRWLMSVSFDPPRVNSRILKHGRR